MRPRHKRDVTILETTVFHGGVLGIYLGYVDKGDENHRHCIAFKKDQELERGKNFHDLSYKFNKEYITKYWPEFIHNHRFFFLREEQFTTDNCVFALYDEKPLKELLWDMEGETLQ